MRRASSARSLHQSFVKASNRHPPTGSHFETNLPPDPVPRKPEPAVGSKPWALSERVARLREKGDYALADRHRGRAPHRRAVCGRAARSTARAPTRIEPATGRRSYGLHARVGGQAVARARPRQGDPVHAQAARTFSFDDAAAAHHFIQDRKNIWKLLLTP